MQNSMVVDFVSGVSLISDVGETHVTTPTHYDLDKAMASGGQASLNAIVIGGTGATGRCLVGSLLKAKVR